jgi:hypothetical protein
MSSHEQQVHVVLKTTADGQDCVMLTLGEAGQKTLVLTPCQARALANDLIAAVNRAEVKANLRVSHNLFRRAGESRPRLQPAG